jgi:lysine-N-methylase
MPMPLRSLPVVQKWDCHGCSDCCRTYAVPVTAAEKERIEKQGWQEDEKLQGVTLFTSEKGGGFALAHVPGGGCVFLGPDNRCRIHAKFGSAAKPIACRAYPFILIPTGDNWRVGMRFTCPSVAKNEGRPLIDHTKDAEAYAAELEPRGAKIHLPPPPLQAGQTMGWTDLQRFVNTFIVMLSEESKPMEWKLRHVLALAKQLRGLNFEKVTGTKLSELLAVLMPAAAEDVLPAEQLPPPGWVGRMIFRQLTAVHTRVDLGPNRGTMTQGGWLTRMMAGYRFAWGGGPVPPVNGLLPPGSRFERAEQFAGPLPPEAEQLFIRYFRVKLESMQFVGRLNFDLPFWAGLDSLISMFPMTLWLSRLLTTDERPREVAIRDALRLIDDSFGFNDLLRGKLSSGLKNLSAKGELPKLVAWYGR